MIIKRNDQFLFGFVIIVLSLPKQTWPICSQSSQSKAVANNIYSAELGNELFKTKSMIEIIISFAGITQSALAFKINLFVIGDCDQSICLPDDYVKFELPPDTPTTVSIGVDIKDIPKVSDKDFSVTLNAYFIVKWRDPRIIVADNRNKSLSGLILTNDHIYRMVKERYSNI